MANIKGINYIKTSPFQILDLLKIKCLKNLQLEELYLEGNPVTRLARFIELLKESLPTLKKIDSYEFAPLSRPTQERDYYERTVNVRGKRHFKNGNDKIDFVGDGDIIRTNDISSLSVVEFKRYEKENWWHQVILYHEGKFRKEALLKALLELVGDHSFYPCYYKQYMKYDEFFLYDCFDAIGVYEFMDILILFGFC